MRNEEMSFGFLAQLSNWCLCTNPTRCAIRLVLFSLAAMAFSSACLLGLFVYALNVPTVDQPGPVVTSGWSTKVTKEADWSRWTSSGGRILAAQAPAKMQGN